MNSCACNTPGFMSETPFLSQAVEDLEYAATNNSVNDISEIKPGNIRLYLPPAGLAVLTGCNEQQNSILVAHIVHQQVFRLGMGCGVFCENAKAFVAGQLSLVSKVGIKKLYTGTIADEEWGYIAHAVELIKGAPLYLGVLPSSLDLLKDSIRRYVARCSEKNSDGDYAVFVFNLSRLIDENTSLAKALQELSNLAVEVDRRIVVVHVARDKSDHVEHEIIWKYADSILELEMRSEEMAIFRQYWQSIKIISILIAVALLFDSERFTVKVKNESMPDEMGEIFS